MIPETRQFKLHGYQDYISTKYSMQIFMKNVQVSRVTFKERTGLKLKKRKKKRAKKLSMTKALVGGIEENANWIG